MPFALARKSHIALTEQGKPLDKPLLDGLAAKGFKLDFGDDGSGWQFKYLTRGGGYYFNVGCSDMIAAGEIALKQYDDIAEFTRDGVRMRDGATIAADLVVLATGYKGQEHLVRKLFGEEIAQRVGPIWGFDDQTGAAQHVCAHAAARPVVHRRQPRAVPDLFEVSRAADQAWRAASAFRRARTCSRHACRRPSGRRKSRYARPRRSKRRQENLKGRPPMNTSKTLLLAAALAPLLMLSGAQAQQQPRPRRRRRCRKRRR